MSLFKHSEPCTKGDLGRHGPHRGGRRAVDGTLHELRHFLVHVLVRRSGRVALVEGVEVVALFVVQCRVRGSHNLQALCLGEFVPDDVITMSLDDGMIKFSCG